LALVLPSPDTRTFGPARGRPRAARLAQSAQLVVSRVDSKRVPGQSPFRERRLPPEEVQRIARRAAALASTRSPVGEALTVAELNQRLAELGIPEDAARLALAPGGPPPVLNTDGSMTVERRLVIEGEVDPARFDVIADAIASAMGTEGLTSATRTQLTWTPNATRTHPRITVRTKGGRTRIRYLEYLELSHWKRRQLAKLAGMGGLAAGALVMFTVAALFGEATAAPLFLLALLAPIASAAATPKALNHALRRRGEARATVAEQVLSHAAAATRACIASKQIKKRVHLDDEVELAEAEAEAHSERFADARA
jgi:hypothetical protein